LKAWYKIGRNGVNSTTQNDGEHLFHVMDFPFAAGLRASPTQVPFFGTQACHVSMSSTCIPFNFPTNGTHFRIIKYMEPTI